MSDPIKRLTIEGFKSIRRLEDFELRSMNVLIGANGAGKSLNLIFSGGQRASFSGATNLSGTAIDGRFSILSGSCVDGSSVGLSLGR